MKTTTSRNQRHIQKRNKTVIKIIIGIVLILAIGGLGFFSADKYAENAYNNGRTNGIRKMQAINRKHPHVKVRYKTIHKKVPVVKNASNAQIEHAVKETHQEDLLDVQNIANKDQRKANPNSTKQIRVVKTRKQPAQNRFNGSKPSTDSSNSDNNDSDLTNHGGGVSLGQALRAEAKADHADVNAKY